MEEDNKLLEDKCKNVEEMNKKKEDEIKNQKDKKRSNQFPIEKCYRDFRCMANEEIIVGNYQLFERIDTMKEPIKSIKRISKVIYEGDRKGICFSVFKDTKNQTYEGMIIDQEPSNNKIMKKKLKDITPTEDQLTPEEINRANNFYQQWYANENKKYTNHLSFMQIEGTIEPKIKENERPSKKTKVKKSALQEQNKEMKRKISNLENEVEDSKKMVQTLEAKVKKLKKYKKSMQNNEQKLGKISEMEQEIQFLRKLVTEFTKNK